MIRHNFQAFNANGQVTSAWHLVPMHLCRLAGRMPVAFRAKGSK